MQVISTVADIEEGVAYLRGCSPILARVHDLTGDPPLRRWEPGFAGLMRIIIGQQLSVHAAAAIQGRVAGVTGAADPALFHRADDNHLRAAGLSASKIRTLRHVAEAILSGVLDLDAAPAEIRRRLLAVKGIGPWTADIYALFCLGEADAFAPGDLALREAARVALNLAERPDPKVFEQLAQVWRPWRGVAARLLWAYYPQIRLRQPEGMSGP